MQNKVINIRVVLNGDKQGKALITNSAFMFAHGVNPKNGEIIDKKCELYGKNIKDKIFIFSNGKGSTTGSMWLLETIRQRNAPAAIVNQETEMIIATGAILGEMMYGKKIPIVDHPDRKLSEIIKTNDDVIIKGKKGTIEIAKGELQNEG